MTRPRPTVEELRRASFDLLYEIQMLGATAWWMSSSSRLNPPRDLANALLESFLVHSRVLHDFFARGSNRADDVLAADFIPVGYARRSVRV